jgi:hypothetical protein
MNKKENYIFEELPARHSGGAAALFMSLVIMLVSIAVMVFGAIWIGAGTVAAGVSMVVFGFLMLIFGSIPLGGLRILKPNEAYVLTLFGKYYGTLKGPGFFFVNPFVTAFKPGAQPTALGASFQQTSSGMQAGLNIQPAGSAKMSLKDRLLITASKR